MPQLNAQRLLESIAQGLENVVELIRTAPLPEVSEDENRDGVLGLQESPHALGKTEMNVIEKIVSGDIPRAMIIFPVGQAGIQWCPINTSNSEMRGMCETFVEGMSQAFPPNLPQD